MSLAPRTINQYYVFLASPGDVPEERKYVRKFFEDYNRQTAHLWNARFEVIDWENYATIGVGRPQELITCQTLEKYRDSLALVVGIMGQRFGTPSGKAESGTEEEFNWAMESHRDKGFPEIKWFFRNVDRLELPADPDEADAALEQWKKVRAFRKRMQDLNDPVFYTEYPGAAGFGEVFRRDLNLWLGDPTRPWAAERATGLEAVGLRVPAAGPVAFDSECYRTAVIKRFDKLNFEMLDTTGAYYSVRLWKVFIPQSVRECHRYNPRLLEIPKDHQERLLKSGEITAAELEEAERDADRMRQEYFHQPLSGVMEVVDEAIGIASPGAGRRLVILGDPGSGKSSLVRYLAVRWAGIAEPAVRDAQPIPLVIDLASYGRWQCEGQKGFVWFLEEGPVWHQWPHGLLERLIAEPGRVVFLLDGLDEIFDIRTREAVIQDIQRLGSEAAHTPIVVTSRVVGYQAQRLRDSGFRHFMLQDLAADQITAFIDGWHRETFDNEELAAPKRDRLKKAIRQSKAIAQLAGNPLLLTMMAILNRNQELPRDRSELYAQASRVLLHQWDTERALSDFPNLSAEIGFREKTEILRRVAWQMQASASGLKGNLIDGSALGDLVEKYLREELHFPLARAAARAVVDHLRLRNFILCFVGGDSYAFVHRTFLEYFCAVELVHRFNVAKTLDEEGLIRLFDDHCADDEWREVLRLVCGQIDETFAGRIVEHLVKRTDFEKWDWETPLPELPLAIGCLSEVRALGRFELLGNAICDRFIKLGASRKWNLGLERYRSETLISAVREVGERWPGVRYLRDQISGTLEKDVPASNGRAFLTKVFVFVTDSRDDLHALISYTKGSSPDVVRGAALSALADKRPDDTTRMLLTQRAVQDRDRFPRSIALRALAEKWPDDATRSLLRQRAVEDQDAAPRGVALQALADKWPGEATRALLRQQAAEDQHPVPRAVALQALADKWPGDATRALLMRRAVDDQAADPRADALRVLAAKWPDKTTRALLAQRAVEDQDGYPRSVALQALADKWPDKITRALLTQRAVDDQHAGARIIALETLAEKWLDDTTRTLLAQRAVEDQDKEPRSVALQALAEKWPDDTTRALLARRAIEDKDDQARGAAFLALAGMHSRFGRIAATQYLDGYEPYLDPLKPIARSHLEKAAERAGLRPNDVNAEVASLSAYLGWDIMRAAKPRLAGGSRYVRFLKFLRALLER